MHVKLNNFILSSSAVWQSPPIDCQRINLIDDQLHKFITTLVVLLLFYSDRFPGAGTCRVTSMAAAAVEAAEGPDRMTLAPIAAAACGRRRRMADGGFKREKSEPEMSVAAARDDVLPPRRIGSTTAPLPQHIRSIRFHARHLIPPARAAQSAFDSGNADCASDSVALICIRVDDTRHS